MTTPSRLSPVDLRVNALVHPFGIDDPAPEFSWSLIGTGTDLLQAAWRVQVAAGESFDTSTVWDSGTMAGDRPFGVRYAGEPLRSRTAYSWRVQVEDADGAS